MKMPETVQPRGIQFALRQLLLLVTVAGGLFLVWRVVLLIELSAAERLVVLAFGSVTYVHFAGVVWLVQAVRGQRISKEDAGTFLFSGMLCAIQLWSCVLLVLARNVELPAPLTAGVILAFAGSSFGLLAMLSHSLRHRRYRRVAVQGVLLAFSMAVVLSLCVAGVLPVSPGGGSAGRRRAWRHVPTPEIHRADVSSIV